jgi:lipopolysaccharide transport system permease protein
MTEIHVYTPTPPQALSFANPFRMVAGLWRHRDLIRQFTVRDILARYRGSHIGILWNLLYPLMMLAVYMFVFGSVLQIKWSAGEVGTRWEGILNLLCGLTLFNLFGDCLSRAPSLVVGNPSYVKKVVFPLEILPVCVLGAALLQALIMLALVAVLTVWKIGTVNWMGALFPLVLLPLVFLSLGVGWLFSALGAFLRDIGFAVHILTQVLLFGSAVFYPVERVPAKYQWVMLANPLTGVLENGRRMLLRGQEPEWGWLLAVTAFAFVFMLFGYVCFMKSKRAFGDVL